MLIGIPSLFAIGTVGGSTLLNGLQAYYKLDDVNDSSGNGITLTNHSSVTFGAGKVGNCASMIRANGQWLESADDSHLHMGTSTNFTICAWCKYTLNDFNQSIVAVGDPGAATRQIEIIAQGTFCAFYIVDDSANQARAYNAFNDFSDGNWHFFLGTVDRAGQIVFYVDNVQQDSESTSGVTGTLDSTTGFNVGKFLSRSFDGSVDEAGFWNRVLTSTEISALWNSGAGVTYPFS
jgi:hypothetical protein